MNKLILDFETRSTIDLKKRGVYVYAAHPTTEVLCCAVKRNDEPTLLWFPKLSEEAELNGVEPLDHFIDDWGVFQVMVMEADELHAHNAQFERLMWHYVMHLRLGFHAQPINRWRCTAAQAAAMALPRSLGQVGTALNLPIQKDNEGYKNMLRMCKPDKKGNWIEDVPSLIKLGKYCIQDVEAEYAVHHAIPELPASEQRIWELDQKINDRGIGIDMAGVKMLDAMVAQAKEDFAVEIDQLTGGKVKTANQTKVILEWLEEEGVEMENMQKGTVTAALEGLPDSAARRLLEIRQTASLASVAKFKAMARLASEDDRVRGAALYHAATTGRWGGQGVQGQNLPRDSYKTEAEVEGVLLGIYEGCAIKAASRCIRGMIIPQDGNLLCAVDYASIEARILAWLAEEQSALDVFRQGLDPYKVVATWLYNVPYDDVTKDQRQNSKVPELACGFGGWIGAFRKFEVTYGVAMGDDEAVMEVCKTWRENRPKTVQLWHGLEEAALRTVVTGKAHKCGKITFGKKGIFLMMRLPSGRMLAYPYPEIGKRTMYYEDGKAVTPTAKLRYDKLQDHELPDGVRKVVKDIVTFMGIDTYTKKWTRLSTYGGKLTENAVQAIARDILCDGMINLDILGFDITMHVHDEIVFEDQTNNVTSVEGILVQPPAWAADLPLGAEGWSARRYRK